MNWLNLKEIIFKQLKAGIDSAEIAKNLNVNEYDLKQFIHRNRIFESQKKGKNLAYELIDLYMRGNPEYFRPSRKFFISVNIKQKRWWALFRGEKTLRDDEYNNLVKHLGITIHEAFEIRQLNWIDELERQK